MPVQLLVRFCLVVAASRWCVRWPDGTGGVGQGRLHPGLARTVHASLEWIEPPFTATDPCPGCAVQGVRRRMPDQEQRRMQLPDLPEHIQGRRRRRVQQGNTSTVVVRLLRLHGLAFKLQRAAK